MWANLASSSGFEMAQELRQLLTEKMTSYQIERAKKLARECFKKNYKGCQKTNYLLSFFAFTLTRLGCCFVFAPSFVNRRIVANVATNIIIFYMQQALVLLQVIWLLFIFGNPSTAYILNVGRQKNVREAIKYLLVIFYNINKGIA